MKSREDLQISDLEISDWALGNCDICVKQKILVINDTKQGKILLKPKVLLNTVNYR